MKSLIVSILVVSICFLSTDIDTIRDSYKEAVEDKTKIKAFNNLVASVTKEDSANLIAYKGLSITLLAKLEPDIRSKKELFVDGVSYIEYAIKKSPNNIEARFLRLTIQENTPKILKYKKNIEEDKLFVLKQYKNIRSTALKNYIKEYILQSKGFTDNEKLIVKE
ncbi:hypothetical protein [Dokdonia sp.]|uniref:hypothetical protein n=1 Tax=Dokdonia sp. TaxID=2024995 RepID=UPI00326724F8